MKKFIKIAYYSILIGWVPFIIISLAGSLFLPKIVVAIILFISLILMLFGSGYLGTLSAENDAEVKKRVKELDKAIKNINEAESILTTYIIKNFKNEENNN